ncbi:MAG TPA: heavy metal translocating P-type ATPase [Candidatus Saccharimonadales bacterium]|nr:heavy metal translocating P-type ATPase [Candidatus Saccharimonadales bacterium]
MKKAVRFIRHYKLFVLAALSIVAGLTLEFTGQHVAAKWLLSLVAIVEVVPLLWGMWQDFRSGTYGIDILAATAIITSVVLQQYWAAIVVVVMLTGGESLEDFAEHRAKAELDALLTRAPQMAHVIRSRKTIDVKASEVRAGDKIIVKPGEVVPVDAEIIEGLANFDESTLTGESLPQTKQVKDQILSGSINLDGAITAKALRSAADSQYQQIIKLVKSAAASQAPFVRLADRYSIPFTITAYAIAISVGVVSGHAIRFLEVIVVATPCPLILAAPIALISGMARASKYGIIVKTGSALEKLAEARVMAFDKTGTLTHGEPTVARVVAYKPYKKDEVLALAASLEQVSTHVLASAIVKSALEQRLRISKAKHTREIAGRGLEAMLGGRDILVGRLSLMKEKGIKFPAGFKADAIQQTAAYVAIDGQLAGVITFKDEVRPETKATLAQLEKLGIKNILMLTGDNQAAAQSIAKKLGIKQFKADYLPADKLRLIEKIADRPVAFVGDGVNDAPVLTAADVGIALGARGSTAASESADMVIMPDDVSRVATAVMVAKRTFYIAKQSILVGIAISLGLMLIFATGKFMPLWGAIIQEVVDVIVIFNALRAHSSGKDFTV